MTNNNYNGNPYYEDASQRYSPADPTNDINGEFWRKLNEEVARARGISISTLQAEQRMAQGGDSPLSPRTIERIVNDVAKSRKDNALETEI